MNKKQAKEHFEDVIKLRNNSPTPFTNEQEQTYRNHCEIVAGIAEKIASLIPFMNVEKAYIIGLLHDCGRIKDEKSEDVFHGWQGYLYANSLGLHDVARISITHCFYDKDTNMNTYPQNAQDLRKCQEYLKKIEYDDYDLLIQLADIMNDMGKTCRIEDRFKSIALRYNIADVELPPMIKKLNSIKKYFEEKSGIDIYELLGI